MKALVLNPGPVSLEYTYYNKKMATPVTAGLIDDYRNTTQSLSALSEMLLAIGEVVPFVPNENTIDLGVIRVPYGGEYFSEPDFCNTFSINKLIRLIPQAPLHLPAIITLIHAWCEIMPDILLVMVFDTSYSTSLPSCEHRYALSQDALPPDDIQDASRTRRFGFHDLFHHAGFSTFCQHAYPDGNPQSVHAISVCLEPQPELAAIIDAKPVMVTSGTTPLEGLPGEHSCGDIDPTIPLLLSERKGWGPEQINTVLACNSGLSAIAERPVTLEAVLSADNTSDLRLTQETCIYRILKACGSAAAVMGRVDGIVYSGRYAECARFLHPELEKHIPVMSVHDPVVCTRDLPSLCLEQALTKVRYCTSVI